MADDLNERLSHRPGPLELIKGNILKADEELARAIKGNVAPVRISVLLSCSPLLTDDGFSPLDGHITFKRTCEGETRKHPPPPFVFEEDSSSEGGMSPLQESDQSQTGGVRSPPDPSVSVPSPSLGSAVSSLSPLSSVASPASSVAPSPMGSNSICSSTSVPSCGAGSAISGLPAGSVVVTSPTSKMSPYKIASETAAGSGGGSGKDRTRKKSKSKSTPKARTIKFHEYKGPPNALKSHATNPSDVETSYELLLQQQQLFLQWQLELQHKYPQIILPASQVSQ